jgi:hypothetical protein
MITFIVLWFLVGFVGLLAACWVAGGSLLVRDLFLAAIFSFLGFACIVILVMSFFLYGDNKWLDKKIL